MHKLLAKRAANLPVNEQKSCLHMTFYLLSRYASLGFEERVLSHAKLQCVGPDGESIAGVSSRLADLYVCLFHLCSM